LTGGRDPKNLTPAGARRSETEAFAKVRRLSYGEVPLLLYFDGFMDIEKAKQILDKADGYVDFDTQDRVCVDGWFTLDEIEAILVVAKSRNSRAIGVTGGT